jgi:hypothetical protein
MTAALALRERPELLAVALGASAAAVAAVAAAEPELARPLLAGVLVAALGMAAVGRPLYAAVATLLFLPFLAGVRRLLILEAGWQSQDPLLLVAPAVAATLCVVLFVTAGRPVARDLLSKLIAGVLAVALVQTLNPAGGGPRTGVLGLLFIGAPLLWFFVGRELATRSAARVVVGAMVGIAAFQAAYGLWQTTVGLPPWDVAWLVANGYYALNVGGVIRGFGTFSSSAEYVLYLGTGIAMCAALGLTQRRAWLIPLPLLAAALFLGSGRSALVATTLALVVVAALARLPPRRAARAVVWGLAATALATAALAPALVRSGALAGNPLAEHQVAGLADPLNPSASTAGVHAQLFFGGLRSGLTQPLGYGTGTTNIAATRTAGDLARPTEIDISDAFVSLGLPGGLLYLAVVALALRLAVVRFAATREPLALAVLGLLVVTLGQWLTGGHYALAPVTWFLVGWLAGGSWVRRPAR